MGRGWVLVSKTVYVVDDDAAVRDSVGILLDAHGYAAQTFASADEFLEGMADPRAACLVLDVNMPGVSGLELLTIVQRRWPQLPVIMVTGKFENLDNLRQALPTGVDLLAKPFADKVLFAAIKRASGSFPD